VVRLRHPEHHVSGSEYTGATEDLKTRMPDHNAGKSVHTAKYIPWKLIWYCAFPDKLKALEFEKHLKSHSGRAFAKKTLARPGLTNPLLPHGRIELIPQHDQALAQARQFPDRTA
jgi:putative endonuclease